MDTSNLNILLIEDDDHYAELVSRLLRHVEASSHDVTFDLARVPTLRQGMTQLESLKFEIVLLDWRLPDSDGPVSIDRLLTSDPDLAIVVLTGVGDDTIGLQSVREGAQDFLTKFDLTAPALIRSLLYAAERRGRRMALQKIVVTEKAMEAAGELQRMLLPKSAPVVPGFDIAGSYWPFDKVGGDYFDYFRMDRHLGLVIADVSGHGLTAAMIMVGLRRLLRSCVEIHTELGEILEIANRAVFDDTQTGQFVTAFLSRLNVITGELEYIGAGHPSYVLHASGRTTRLESSNLPLGVTCDGLKKQSHAIRLVPGDLLVLLTDGLYEAMSPDRKIWGIDNVLRVIDQHRHQSAEEIIGIVYAAIHAHVAPNSVSDDIALIVVKVLELH